MRRHALGQLDGGDAQRPDVRLVVVLRLLDHFGAIQKGVPIIVCRFESVLSSCADTPKSASFATPSSFSRMLPDLMS